jgi:nitroimidazol reductase NimA-like FMN-containing flavoprotein (pyridoxamine 5'-phosphate oxidase superfamily)
LKTKSNAHNLSKDEIDDFLSKNRAGVLSLTDGMSPYALPFAYFYGDSTIYLTISLKGRKKEYLKKNKNVCFTVFRIPDNFGTPGKTSWTSVICEGVLEAVKEPEELKKAVRIAEKHMGTPEGSLENLLQMILKDPGNSSFWKINLSSLGGRGVENEKIEFEE